MLTGSRCWRGRPTDALWRIGAKTAKKLAGLGIRTVSDLAAADPDALAEQFGPMTGPWLVLLGRGRGDADVDDSPYVARGHGREETFQRNITDWSAVQAEVTRTGDAPLAFFGGCGDLAGRLGRTRAVHRAAAGATAGGPRGVRILIGHRSQRADHAHLREVPVRWQLLALFR